MKRIFFTALLALMLSDDGRADEPTTSSPRENETGQPGTPTLGGKQFWADQLLFRDWRIQLNVITGHYRLLDGDNARHTFGSFETCQGRLDEIRTQRDLPPMQGSVVLVLHGLGRSRTSMEGISRFLRINGDYTVLNISYPSTRADVATHARSLARIIDNLPGIDEIHFVAHSLGNLVVRRYLFDHTDPATNKTPDPRIKRMVMLGPPNRGAKIAERFGRNGLFELIAGKSGRQIASQWSELEKQLAIPAFQFGVIAGGNGGNPLVPGDNDLVVSVAETRLPGAHDFSVLPTRHTFMMDNLEIQVRTLRFLRNGYFVSAENRAPIISTDER